MISRRTQTVLTRVHTAVLRLTGGRVGARLAGMEMVLLTTTGRSSGRSRTTPLTGIGRGDRLVLIASDGGRPRSPQWYRNLLVDPQVTVRRGRRDAVMRARTATPVERAQLWPVAVRTYPGYARYQARTDREIPVVICEPVS